MASDLVGCERLFRDGLKQGRGPFLSSEEGLQDLAPGPGRMGHPVRQQQTRYLRAVEARQGIDRRDLEILRLLGVHQRGQRRLHSIQAAMVKQADGLEPVFQGSGLVSGDLARALHVGLDHGGRGGREPSQPHERSAGIGQAFGHAEDDLLSCGRPCGQHRIGRHDAQDPPQLPRAFPGPHRPGEPGQPLDRFGLRQKRLLVGQPGEQLVSEVRTGTQDGVPDPEVTGVFPGDPDQRRKSPLPSHLAQT